MLIPNQDRKPKGINLGALLLATFVLAIGGLSASYVYKKVDEAGRSHILERTATIAVAVPQEDLALVAGTEEDLGTLPYESLKEYLARMRSVNPDARFLYLIGQRSTGELFFFADSESAESPDYSPPGQVYYEATPGMYAVFEDAVRRTEGPDQDRWGIWISGYAPVLDEAGKVVALLGMDLPAQNYIVDAVAYALLPFLVSVVVVTGIFALERMRRQELLHLELKEEFLSIASHEIRTPLTGIRWAIEGLLKRRNPPLDARSAKVLSLVHESCLGLIGRVNNLLDLTALEGTSTSVLRPEPLPLHAFLEDLVDSLTLSAQQRHVTLALDAGVKDAGSVVADRQMLHHALFNLLTNAIKYTREGTTVSISYERAGGMHRIRIADQGNGIPEGAEARIFSGYSRTDEAVRSGAYGTGLGLYLVKKAAELHKGTIEVRSIPGKGATFILSLPATPS
ncbi:MAG TPA: HAMP domain-containing sensor histidine kinase [Candidatus Paceibacterota bacterium]|nr:HAMP domain-containing sensor histidine kinase [Candidatus Paceibacterota bacterium]